MKIHKFIGASLLLISLIGLFGCSANQSIQKQHVNSEKAPSIVVQNDQSGQTDTNQTAEDSNSTGKNVQYVSKSKSSSLISISTSKNTPPQTRQEALNQVAKALKTKVPFMLPTNIPVSKGKYLTATTTSETWYYQVHFYETNKPANVDSKAAANGASIVTVEGTEYKDAESAKNTINGYYQVQNPTLNLGHGIKAMTDAGAGHNYIMWNEGRWSIGVDSPNDTTYINKKYPDSKKLAKEIVAYLENHTLPAPQRIGVIRIDNWNHAPMTTIQWQFHEMIYQVTSQDPFKALETTVVMKIK